MASTKQKDRSSTPVSTPTDRRRNARFPFSATVDAIDTKSDLKVSGRTGGLGLGGCYVDTLNPFPMGTEAKIRIYRGNETFEARAKVVYSLNGMGMGLAFTSIDPKQLHLFQKWLPEMDAQPAALPDILVQDEPTAAPAEQIQASENSVLSDLIAALMRKEILREEEGKEFLRRLS
jgi:hypothetical protein